MDCIWEGDMTISSDLIKFQAILENTHTWAMHEQRSRISTYIDLWKSKHPVGRNPSTDQLQVSPSRRKPRRRESRRVDYETDTSLSSGTDSSSEDSSSFDTDSTFETD